MNYIDVNALYQLLLATPELVIIDVRSPEEYQVGHLPQAKLVSIDTILKQPERATEEILQLARGQETIYIICLSDRRSFMACHTLAKQNILNTCFIKGGTQDWIAAGHPVISGD